MTIQVNNKEYKYSLYCYYRHIRKQLLVGIMLQCGKTLSIVVYDVTTVSGCGAVM